MENNSFTFNFKSLLLGTVLVCGLILVYSFLMGKVISQIDSNHLVGASISENEDVYREADVIFIGDSRANQGLDPNVFNEYTKTTLGRDITSMNLGRPAMQPPFYYLILRDYLDNVEKKPKVVVANISFYLLAGTQWMNDIYFTYYTPKFWQVMNLSSSGVISLRKGMWWYVKTRISALRFRKKLNNEITAIAYDPSIKLLLQKYDYTEKIRRVLFDSNNYGYLSRGNEHTPMHKIVNAGTDTYVTGLDSGYPIYQDYIKKFFDLCAENRIHVVLYDFPWPEELRSTHLSAVLEYYQDLFRAHAANNRYVHFVDNASYWSLDYFADPLHVNQYGANKLSQMAVTWSADHLAETPN